MKLHKIVPPKIKKKKLQEKSDPISYNERYFNPTFYVNSKQWPGIKDLVVGEKKVLCIKVEITSVSSSQFEGQEKQYNADLRILEIGEDLDNDE